LGPSAWGDKVLDITVAADRRCFHPGRSSPASIPDFSQLLRKGDRILENVTRITASLDEFLAGTGSGGQQNLTEVLRSLRTTLEEVEKGEGLLHGMIYGREGGELLARVDRTMGSLERFARALENERGLLHALIYTPQEESLGRLTRSLAGLEDLLRDVREGRGLLHALIYEPRGTEILARLDRMAEEMEGLVRAAREGKGLIPSLFFDPAGAKALEDVRAAAADVRAAAEDMQVIAARLRQGEGTLGALLEDATVYEDLSALLRGANRSWLLRSLIRSTRDDAARENR
jgi:phospholipid/cholesterol/gamma-HCH transport system substrate-binding protein